MALDDIPSSPPSGGWGSIEDELAYYKGQYETLEAELQEFQASSKELEAELEKDVEESEKRERKLKEKVESLGYEVEEWKAKCKQAKSEANSAQAILQKEITSLRDAHRTIQLKLRDIEVQNDDFERQTRNQSSSLEDLESKYNVAIERTVMLDEEIKIGEQEREGLRIENQRLREELSDLRIEAEIVQEKLSIAEQSLEAHHQRKTSQLLAVDSLRPRSPVSETSTSATTLSSPTASTPPRSKADTLREDATPPSPPLSETSINAKPIPSTPMPVRKTSKPLDPATTPRPGYYTSRAPRHSRGPSIPVSAKSGATGASGRTTPSIRTTAPPPKTSRPSVGGNTGGGLPRSGSLYQIRGLIGKMQKLEERVYSARSKLPAPTNTPPRASPRNGSALGHHIPNTVTVRSTRKRVSAASTVSSINGGGDSGVSRLSFGMATGSREPSNSRPSSRASMTSQPGNQRPISRSSNRTPLGHYSTASIGRVEGRIPRPRSSLSGASGGHSHSRSMSISDSLRDAETDNHSDGSNASTPLARRMTLDKTGIPTPSGLPRRQSAGRRTSAGLDGEMGPPDRPARARKMSEIGETY
ncbi:nuclear distribution protein nude [Clohesyomyces aquaticus]|uniref:Nuclear distribution protein nude n=1 Tax=Clohesyomyces aquaticus TaxID=1231657 RepID=A0A1Y2A6H6_9PLEO|nr:nuclear distribution protein nude [Clohesyomyces aquaticus]